MSVILWHGVPGCGKSTVMRAALEAALKARPLPAIVLDPGHVPQWADLPRGKTLRDVHAAAWTSRTHIAFAPSPDDAEALFAALIATGRESGGFYVCIDELREYASGKSVGDNLVNLARRHRHSDIALYLGTQSIGDVRTELLAAVDTVYTGRNTAPYNLEILQRRYGLDPAAVGALGRGQFLKNITGFSEGE